VPALTGSQEFALEGHPLLFRTIGAADGMLATIVHVPDLQAICSGDIAYNNIHMWMRNSTPASREAWLASLDAVAALKPSTIITGHKDPMRPTTTRPACSTSRAATSRTSAGRWPGPAPGVR
jgi:hypothetical protein